MITFFLRRWWLAKAFQEQTAVFHCVNVCVDWPLFALPTTITCVNICVDWPLFALPTSITGDYHPPETPIVYHRVRKCKFSKCRIAYYPNAMATRSILLLSGDIEVNPGWGNGLKKFDSTHVSKNQRSVGSTPPVISDIPVRISERRYSTHSYLNQHQSPTRISIKRVPFIKSSSTPLSLCLLNSRSVRNKSAAFFDYICECKADLVAVTETWLRCCDDAIRAELCLDGYKLLDHVRDCRQGGGTALLFRDSLTVK